MEPRKRTEQNSGPLGPAGWIAIIVLLGLLVGAALFAFHAWNEVPAVSIPALGWVFLTLGIVITLAVGGGLMALVFYSSRKGRDF